MASATVCGICEASIAITSCPHCGTPVCREHYDRVTDTCRACTAGARRP